MRQITCLTVTILVVTVNGFSLSSDQKSRNGNGEILHQALTKDVLDKSFPSQGGILAHLMRKPTQIISDRLPDSLRRRRDLGGTTDPFGGSRYRWKLKPGKPKATSPAGGTDRPSSDRQKLAYNYQFWGDKFHLKGNVTAFQYNRKLRVVFTYKIRGIANASMELARQDLKNSAITWTASGAQKPRSCRFQLGENQTTLVQNPKLCSQPLKRAAPFTNPAARDRSPSFDTEADDEFDTTDRLPPSKRKLNVGFPQDACAAQLETHFTQTWLCIEPELPPCFLLTVQDENYKVAETICPKRLPVGRQVPTQKLYSGIW